MTADKLVMRLREMSTRLTQHRDDRDTWGAAADELEKRAAIIVTERIEARAAITAAVQEESQNGITLSDHEESCAVAARQAVEEERKRWVRVVLDRDELGEDWLTEQCHDPEFARGFIREGLKLEAEGAALGAVEEREKELIPLVCGWCASGSEPRRHVGEFAGGIWWEHLMQGLPKCPASPLHEAIYQRGPAAAEGDGDG